MRFSKQGYYIESYVKCANCGVLLYDEGLPGHCEGKPAVFCSKWCHEWTALRESNAEERILPLPDIRR
jgi:5-oxoprolinase (ATP-hydrolysing)/N-methylhydantoinase B